LRLTHRDARREDVKVRAVIKSPYS
jgi:hypothetical protein